jgi:hypothetical protein
MKKTIAIMGVVVLSFLSLITNAQDTTQNNTSKWNPKMNPTVDSITSPYANKMLPKRPPLTTADIFPALGTYESATNTDAPNVSISLDEQNKGLVWIEGLPQGKVKAMLFKSPATYKIPAQKTEDGKDVAEGTLIFDKETNTLSISIGKSYNVDDPAMAFAPATEEPEQAPVAKVKKGKVKVKTPAAPKPWVYTGTKVVKETVMTTNQ